jgi:tetratricopeptide (TPR) repeat protein
MLTRAIRIVSLAMLLALAGGHAAAQAPLPQMAGASDAQAKERAALFAALAAAKNDPEARAVEDRLWLFWGSFADAESQRLLAASHAAQLRFDYGNAIVAMETLVRHQPEFAEGWNQLAYVLYLAGSYDQSLEALEKTLALEPMHYAALAGKGIILIRQGEEAEAQAPLKRALAINPWLKERNLVSKNPVPVP